MVNPFVNWVLFLSSSSWPGDVIWWHGSGSTLDQIVVCCLVAPSHYLNQWSPIITDGNFTENVCNSGNETTDILHRTQCVKLNVFSVPWSLLLLRSKFVMHITVCCIRLCMRMPCSALTLGHPQTRQKITNIPVKYEFVKFNDRPSHEPVMTIWLRDSLYNHERMAICFGCCSCSVAHQYQYICRHRPLCGEFTSDWWIPHTNGQWSGKCFHLMTSSWIYD